MGVVVHIDRFSGPLALLLHLIRQEEMDIFDINIQAITQQYLESIKSMKKLNLEVAGDFIAMAATLIQIKSKMLLPQYNEEGEVIEDQDPRRDLVRRLIEYQMFQEAGHKIYKRSLLGRDVWVRGRRERADDEAVADSSVIIEEDNALYSLITLYRGAVKRMNKAVHRVSQSLQSIADRVWQMRSRLVIGETAKLSELVNTGVNEVVEGQVSATPDEPRGRLLITFLSLLELAKIGIVNLFQSDNYAEIFVETKKAVDRDSISKVESYDSQVKNEVTRTNDIYLSDNDRAEAAASEDADLPLMAVAAENKAIDEEFIVEAATDDEIELEEQLYGQETTEQTVEEVKKVDVVVGDLDGQRSTDFDGQLATDLHREPEPEPGLS